MRLSIYSVIDPIIKKRLQIRALFFSIPGVILLLGMGTFAPLELLSQLGIPTFFGGMFLIAWGMIPYRKLLRIRKIAYSEEEIAGIPLQEIVSLHYLEKKHLFGIQMELKGGKRIFFPYFTQSAYASLNDVMHPDQTD